MRLPFVLPAILACDRRRRRSGRTGHRRRRRGQSVSDVTLTARRVVTRSAPTGAKAAPDEPRDTQCRNEGAVLFVEITAPTMNLLQQENMHDLVYSRSGTQADDACQVRVFSSADPDYFISHVDVNREPQVPRRSGRLSHEPSIALLFRRLSAGRPISIARPKARCEAGRGSRSHAICASPPGSQPSSPFEPAFRQLPDRRTAQRLVPLIGRAQALEVMLGAQDFDAASPSDTAGSTGPCQQARWESASGRCAPHRQLPANAHAP